MTADGRLRKLEDLHQFRDGEVALLKEHKNTGTRQVTQRAHSVEDSWFLDRSIHKSGYNDVLMTVGMQEAGGHPLWRCYWIAEAIVVPVVQRKVSKMVSSCRMYWYLSLPGA